MSSYVDPRLLVKMQSLEFYSAVLELYETNRVKILEEIQSASEISESSDMDFRQLIMIMNTAGTSRRTRLFLLKYVNKVQNALHPKFPRDFTHKRRIGNCLLDLKKAFMFAVSANEAGWLVEIKSMVKMAMRSGSIDNNSMLNKILEKVGVSKQKKLTDQSDNYD